MTGLHLPYDSIFFYLMHVMHFPDLDSFIALVACKVVLTKHKLEKENRNR
jgi:hypothetical protein